MGNFLSEFTIAIATAHNSYQLGTLSNMQHDSRQVSGCSVQHQQLNEKTSNCGYLK